MVESDGIGKSISGEPGAGEAAQALRAILQTQYLRYLIIGTWAVGKNDDNWFFITKNSIGKK